MKAAWKYVVFSLSLVFCFFMHENFFPLEMPVISAAGEINSPPFSFKQNKNAEGFSVELLQEIAATMKLKINVLLERQSDLKSFLKKNQIDIFLFDLSDDDNVEHSIPYITVYHSIFVRKCCDIRTINEAINKDLIFYQSPFLHKILNRRKSNQTILADSPLAALQLLSSGYGDCVIMPHYQGNYLINTNQLKNLSFRKISGLSTELRFAVKKDNKHLLNIINQGILKLKAMGKIEKLYSKWFGKLDYHINFSYHYLKNISYIITPVIFLFLLFVLWSWSLKIKVRKRTIELTESNCKLKEKAAELEKSIETLNAANDHIVQMGKMAALGELVSGVAHEINTPVGIGVSAASHLYDNTNKIYNLFSSNDLSKDDLEDYLSLSKQVSEIVLSNLNRATNLINNFKLLAVEKSSEKKSFFYIKKHTEEIISNFSSMLIENNHHITVVASTDKEIYSYAGYYSQIIHNLIMNSILHGFDRIKSGEITIEIIINGSTVIISYQDNGKGIENKNIKKIFELFYTTRRNKGCIGIGLNIVYNIVTQIFRGKIECESDSGTGAKFIISFPLVSQD